MPLSTSTTHRMDKTMRDTYISQNKCIHDTYHTAAILNSIVLTEKLWAAEGAIAGQFIVYTAFRINFYCLSLIFHNKYYKRYIFPSRYLAVVPMVIEKLLLKVITPQYSF